MTLATIPERLEARLNRILARTSIEHGVLSAGDRILVALSGGKDSYGLLHLLQGLKPRLPFSIELVAVHVEQGQPGFDNTPLRRWLVEHDVPHEIVVEDTYSTVQKLVAEGDTPCAVCARLRRGILYTTAARLGCNKVALGHHRDDALATLLLNLFYTGTLQAMPARYRTDDGRFEVIRPLIEIAESDLVALAEQQGFPIVPCVLCSGHEDHQRKAMGSLIDGVAERHPQVRTVMLAALRNVRPSHLLDRDLLRRTQPVDDVAPARPDLGR
ncbi:MAG: tRNA 2-thiocytidine(32) synthetase TtcA [Pseudomonadota bacterium]